MAESFGGSGYLVGRRLVLTARHVLVDESTGEWWPRRPVILGHPDAGPVSEHGATPVWRSIAHDVALVRLDDLFVSGAPPVRWGRFTGSDVMQTDRVWDSRSLWILTPFGVWSSSMAGYLRWRSVPNADTCLASAQRTACGARS